MSHSKSIGLLVESAKLIRKSKLLAAKSQELQRRSDTNLAIAKLLRDVTKKSIVKACKCGAEYKPSQWFRLKFVGYQYAVEGIKGEMRNCKVCNSTLFFVTFKASLEELRKLNFK